jgi:hypothetical protein
VFPIDGVRSSVRCFARQYAGDVTASTISLSVSFKQIEAHLNIGIESFRLSNINKCC